MAVLSQLIPPTNPRVFMAFLSSQSGTIGGHGWTIRGAGIFAQNHTCRASMLLLAAKRDAVVPDPTIVSTTPIRNPLVPSVSPRSLRREQADNRLMQASRRRQAVVLEHLPELCLQDLARRSVWHLRHEDDLVRQLPFRNLALEKADDRVGRELATGLTTTTSKGRLSISGAAGRLPRPWRHRDRPSPRSRDRCSQTRPFYNFASSGATVLCSYSPPR
jgi:hypothetical protein